MNPLASTLAVIDGPLVWLVLIVVVLLFGGSKLPELARGLGKARREFKKASEEVDDEIRNAIEEDERKKVRAKIDEEERAKMRAKVEDEERAKIRARVEEEERAKLAAEKNKQA